MYFEITFFLVKMQDQPFWILVEIALTELGTFFMKSMLYLQMKTIHSSNAYFYFEFEGKKYVVDLYLNKELLPKTFQTSTVLENGQLFMHKPAPSVRKIKLFKRSLSFEVTLMLFK